MEWYEPYQEQMRKDELMRFFYELRTKILKEGDDGIRKGGTRPGGRGGHGSVSITPEGISYVIQHEDGTESRSFVKRPSNAIASFIGDVEGGSGWEVRNPDGSVSKVYVQLPAEAIDVSLEFENPPKTHLGNPIEDNSVGNICGLYAVYLRQLVKEAQEHFGNI